MGGIKSFFKKIGNGISKAGRFVRDKVIPTVGRIATPVLNVISALPGKIGMVGKIGGTIANILHGAVSKIPNKDARERIDNVISRGNETFQGVVDRGRDIANGANRAIGVGRDVVNDIQNNPATQKLINHFKKLPVDTASIYHPK